MNAHSLNDLKKKEEEGKSDRNEYFAGGTDGRGNGSGLSVIGPPGDGDNGGGRGLIDGIVGRAMNPSDAAGLGGPATGGRTRITLYANGFQVADGPLRDATAPENVQFLSQLMAGRVPAELGATGDMEIDLVDKRGEEFVAPPPPAYIAFSGEGNSLSAGGDADAESHFDPSNIPDGEPTVDASAPSTTLQVRLSSGKKIRMKLNHSHTVSDILRLIRANGGAGSPFKLSAGFPPKAITVASQTVEEAGLVGESITQS